MKLNLKYLIMLTLCYLAFSCGSDDDNTSSISSINPLTGAKETIVTITGANFGTDSNAVEVFFNGVRGSINSITDTEIKAVVSPKSFSGEVTLVISGNTIIGPEFNYIITYVVSTLAGSETSGSADGTGSNAQFVLPAGITIDSDNNLFVTDGVDDRIRKITPQGIVSTIAGSTRGFLNGNGSTAQFARPFGITIDSDGNLYVGDGANHVIRKITPSGDVSTFAGDGTQGFTDGNITNAQFNFPTGITIDADSNLYVTDQGNSKIRKITPSGDVSTFAGDGTRGSTDGNGTNAQFNQPRDIAVDSDGNLYVADQANHKIRKITPSGDVSTFAGDGTAGFADGNGTNAQFSQPTGVTMDSDGNLYIVDAGNNKIRKITPQRVVNTIAGSTRGFLNGNGTNAQFSSPAGIAIDTNSDLFVTDISNRRIRKIIQE